MPSTFPPGPADRTARFLAGIGANPARTEAARRVHVELVADRLDPASEIALALTTTLLLRMADYAPTIHLIAPNDRTVALPLLSDAPLPHALVAAHSGFSSIDRLTMAPAAECDLRLVFGGGSSGVAVATSGWSVALGEGLAGEGNALAASYAGVLAAGEVLKILLAPLGATELRARPWRGTVSLWDNSLSAQPGPKTEFIDFGPHTWIGAGGVASAVAWSLAVLAATGTCLTGIGTVVDHDVIDEDGTNLNRHLTALFKHRGMAKAELLADLIEPAGLRLQPQQIQWHELSQAQRHPCLAIVSVDDDSVRRAVQRDMPALIINGGTGDAGEYQVTRHNFIDHACLACISHADETVAGPEHALARRLGLPPEELQPHLHSREPLPDEILARLDLDVHERDQIATIPARMLLEHFCATLNPEDGPAVSIPMLSAAAGILLAVELTKNALGQPFAPGQVVRTNILTGPHQRWRSVRAKSDGCLCHDTAYQHHYCDRWSVVGSTR